MKIIYKTILFLLSAIAIHCKGVAQDLILRSFVIGETNVPVIEKRFNQCALSNVLFINVHDNERTSVQAAEEYLSLNNGLLVRLENNGVRNVSFTLNSKSFLFDPNRIFTSQGRKATLKLLSTSTSEEAETRLASFADMLLNSFINSFALIVALHNNTDSNFTILTFQQQQQAKPNSGKVFINPNLDADDFILTTDTTIFNSLQQKNINAVWEDVSMIEDDGSLSVYAAMHNITYINIEAEHGHFEQQLAMLSAIREFLVSTAGKEKIERHEYLYAPDK